MREGEPSRTAYGAARLRAEHQELDGARIFADPLAARVLDGIDAGADPTYAGRDRLRIFVAARHRFAEEGLAAAVERGTRQVVVLGAGLDTFAYRNPFPDTRVFEVDFPATGDWKRERLADVGIEVPANVVYVGVDFERHDLLSRLVESGFDATATAYFVWLGVVPYLSVDAVTATLRAIAAVPGGEVALDYATPIGSDDDRARRRELHETVADVGEPFNEGFDPATMRALLEGLGFTEIEDLGRREIRSRYLGLPPGDSDGSSHVLRAFRRP